MQWKKLSVSTETKERYKLITSFQKLCDRNSCTLPNNPTYSSDQIVKEGGVHQKLSIIAVIKFLFRFADVQLKFICYVGEVC